MSYNTKYFLPFRTINNIACELEIQEEGFEGQRAELTGGVNSFTVSIDDEDFLYTPVRFSTATIRLVGDDRMQSLFSTNYQQFRVNLKRAGVITWIGFISPEMYTQDYSSEIFELEIQCVSAMSVLEHIDYKIIGEDYAFVSIWHLINKCITESKGNYSAVYIPKVYGSDKQSIGDGIAPLDAMLIGEHAFFDKDEDREPLKLKEILEEVCKFLNWTCVDWKGELYFVDIDHVGEYSKYNLALMNSTSVTIDSSIIQNIGFSDSDHTLDILGGYNKVKVINSNYELDSEFPKEDIDTLKPVGMPYIYQHEDAQVLRELFFESSVFNLHKYKRIPAEDGTSNDTYSETKVYDNYNIYGAYQTKRCCYKLENVNGAWVPNITNYKYDDTIRLKTGEQDSNGVIHWLPYLLPLITYNPPFLPLFYTHCALAINFSIQALVTVTDGSLGVHPFAAYKNLQPDADFRIYCKLSIGYLYWDGDKWTDNNSNVFGISIPLQGIINGGFSDVRSTKTIDMPYNGLDGYIVPIDKNMYGTLKFEVLCPGPTSILSTTNGVAGYSIKGFSITYQEHDMYKNRRDSDTTYSNTVNGSYINSLDDIDLKISTYNYDGLCHNKVLFNNEYLTDNLFSEIENQHVRIEEQLVRRVVNQYKTTKTKLSYALNYDNVLSPLSVLYDNSMPDKKFTIIGGEINFADDKFTLKIIENSRN